MEKENKKKVKRKLQYSMEEEATREKLFKTAFSCFSKTASVDKNSLLEPKKCSSPKNKCLQKKLITTELNVIDMNCDPPPIATCRKIPKTCMSPIIRDEKCIKSIESDLLPEKLTDCKNKSQNQMLRLIDTEKENVLVPNEDSFINGSTPNMQSKCDQLVNEDNESDRFELEEMLEGMDEDIDILLEETAQKKNLSAINVKNILRHIVTNDLVLAMVRNTMRAENSDCDDMETAVYEPKLTRAKVKELREKQVSLPWPVLSPVKQNGLLNVEFSDNESTSDEEYCPNQEEVEGESDDDKNMSQQSMSSSPPSLRKLQSDSVAQICPNEFEEELNPPLVIVLPETLPHEEKLDDTEQKQVDDEDYQIALRTRSKVPLVDTPLETIESLCFTPDMFDTACPDDEDWMRFLNDFVKPLDQKETVDGPDDNREDDPDFDYFEEDDVLDSWDFRTDKAVKITKQEISALMAGILEAAEQDGDGELETSQEMIDCILQTVVPPESSIEKNPEELLYLGRSQVRLRIEEQMRMHVQLLSQSFLVTHGIKKLEPMTESAQILLEELKMFATCKTSGEEKSAFDADNLDEALNIIKSYTSSNTKTHISHMKRKGSYHAGIQSKKVKKTMAYSKVFIYPDLLPTCGFQQFLTEKRKPLYSRAEDNLIALGLEQFSSLKDTVGWIQKLLVPTKSVRQLKTRIDNRRKNRVSCDNPIKYYYSYGQAPPFSRDVRPYDPENVLSCHELPKELLPKWMVQSLRVRTIHKRKPIQRCKYRSILPRCVMPLKENSSELRKYQLHIADSVVPVITATSGVSFRTNSNQYQVVTVLKDVAIITKKNSMLFGQQDNTINEERVNPEVCNMPSTEPDPCVITSCPVPEESPACQRVLSTNQQIVKAPVPASVLSLPEKSSVMALPTSTGRSEILSMPILDFKTGINSPSISVYSKRNNTVSQTVMVQNKQDVQSLGMQKQSKNGELEKQQLRNEIALKVGHIPNNREQDLEKKTMKTPSKTHSKKSEICNSNLDEDDTSINTSKLPIKEQNLKKIKWKREEDKHIFLTCQKLGVNDDTFQIIADALCTKSVQQVKDRFTKLVQLFQEIKQEILENINPN